jgi:peptidoglycan/LPS O-acetylase OafA/YrhL
MFIKLLLSHIVISLISVFILLSIATVFDYDIVYYTTFLIVLSLYFYSGYLFTGKKVKWYNYFATAIVGLLLFGICFYISANSTNYKNIPKAGLWLYYQLYVMASSPLNHTEALDEGYSVTRDLLLMLLLPMLYSCLQFAGGIFKQKQL